MDIVEQLKIEHQLFLELLDYLGELIKNEKSKDGAGLQKVVFAIARLLLKHEEIEENFLFPALEPHVASVANPVKIMKFEHKALHRILEVIQKAADVRSVKVESKKFIICLQDHIAKEEGVIFPLAKKKLKKTADEDKMS